MSFAGHYLEKHALYSNFISENPKPGLFISVVIPCFNEPDLISSLDSLWNCIRPGGAVEVIVVVNASEKSTPEEFAQNDESVKVFNEWIKNHVDEKLRFYLVIKNDLPAKDAGVGLARKIGMDEAVRRFDLLNLPLGVIVGYDADSCCKENYLVEIEKLFKENKKINACSIHFEHPLKGVQYDKFIYDAVTRYELYLRYYIEALRTAGHPFAFQTIGSSFAVRADVYCAQGGMNKRKAGEDFYFLQKVIPLGNYVELNTTKVIPSPRPSVRVPFGTGAAIEKMRIVANNNYLTYDIRAFDDIAFLLQKIDEIFKKDKKELGEFLENVSEPLQSFLLKNDFIKHVTEIKQNVSSLQNFSQRFYRWFDAFKVLKFMNFSHQKHYTLKAVVDVVRLFLLRKGIQVENCTERELLEIFRKSNFNTH
jgi:glycosyltransferase involved in cell wall biosynthesis